MMSLSFVHVGVCHHEICAQRGLLWYFIVVYYCGILLWYSIVVFYCGILLWYSIVVFSEMLGHLTTKHCEEVRNQQALP